MNKHIITSCLLGIIVACQSAVSAPEDYLSPVDLVAGKDSKVIYVVEHTASKIAVFDKKHIPQGPTNRSGSRQKRGKSLRIYR
jgi:hypothetical protein